MKPKKILLIQTAFIGDVILATSLIEYLKLLFPGTQIDFLLRKGNESLVKTNPHIQQVLIWDKKEQKTLGLFKLLFKVRKEQYDAVINIQRFFNSGILTAFSGAKIKIGFAQNPLSFFFTHRIEHKIPYYINDTYLHEVQRNAQLVIPLIGDIPLPLAKDLRPIIYFSDEDHEVIQKLNLPQQYFVLAPSSVWYTKQWHEDKWKELITSLSSQAKIFILGAPSDLNYCKNLYSPENSQVINLCGKLSLRQSALLMQKAKRVFVNDSAPLHLASSVDAKTTAIFCSTIPEFGYAPLSHQHTIIQLKPRLSCMPCGLHGHKACPENHFKCAMDISVAEVMNTI